MRHSPFVALFLLQLTASPLAAHAASYPLAPGQAAVGEMRSYTTVEKDKLLDLAVTYDLGYTELIAANRGIDPWSPEVGSHIVVPTLHILPTGPRSGIVVNLATQRLFYFPPGGNTVETYPIGVGVPGRVTPVGTTTIVRKGAHPSWVPTPSIRAEEPDLPAVVPPGPDNPMGDYALYLGWRGYAIHGTNRTYGIGRNLTHGCIRLYPQDIERLFREIPVGTRVTVISGEVQTAKLGGELYLSVYPTRAQIDELDVGKQPRPDPVKDLHGLVSKAAGADASRISWSIVDTVGRERTGVPTQITLSNGAGPAASSDAPPADEQQPEAQQDAQQPDVQPEERPAEAKQSAAPRKVQLRFQPDTQQADPGTLPNGTQVDPNGN